ncbi:LANO_0E14796g1_1 [Lachancea nothofagi CBS 11611]|uniref:LANO_0E14796g1_1 n=1 Tax=Lachancea nothofagi CBS 11611 TaxID=1266666 RepID=A0A1G4K0C7_9SACH|nr:LANO_0E14796g1_1 [Lachancea nothofagi CBS 11611]
MVFRLIMVDPRPSKKIVPSKETKHPSGRRDKISPWQEQKELPVIMQTFDSGEAEKGSSCHESRRARKKPLKIVKPQNSSVGTKTSGLKSPLLRQPVSGAKKIQSCPHKPFTFVSSVVNDYHLEYANTWQSSFEFDGKKPQRPLFRIKNPRFRKASTKHHGSVEPSNVIDPNFTFSHNSLNGNVRKNGKQPPMTFNTNPVFRISLNDR